MSRSLCECGASSGQTSYLQSHYKTSRDHQWSELWQKPHFVESSAKPLWVNLSRSSRSGMHDDFRGQRRGVWKARELFAGRMRLCSGKMTNLTGASSAHLSWANNDFPKTFQNCQEHMNVLNTLPSKSCSP